jgi:alanine dehydrogenase
MRVGVAREIKPQEYRVALTPAGARELVQRGHDVLVETAAGVGSAFADAAYERVGASIVSVDDVWGSSELLLKVKEPIAAEYQRLRPGLTLFTYLHIAADEPLTRALVESGITAIAYETVETATGALPLLAPMSEIAGRLAPQAGAHHLEKPHGGRGILLGGVAGVAPARVLVFGGGIVGYNAAVIAIGMGAQVTVLEKEPRVAAHQTTFGAHNSTLGYRATQRRAKAPSTGRPGHNHLPGRPKGPFSGCAALDVLLTC